MIDLDCNIKGTLKGLKEKRIEGERMRIQMKRKLDRSEQRLYQEKWLHAKQVDAVSNAHSCLVHYICARQTDWTDRIQFPNYIKCQIHLQTLFGDFF